MNALYTRIRDKALAIAQSAPAPSFYEDFKDELCVSRRFYKTEPTLVSLMKTIKPRLVEELGHGVTHVTKVTEDAGALVLIETREKEMDEGLRAHLLLLVQCAGLLHDIKRREKGHALKGAGAARKILKVFNLPEKDIDKVGRAIANHEAFKIPAPLVSSNAKLISDCLYDADKFRWGPDNFTDTVWHMISEKDAPLSVFIRHYPEAIKGLARIKTTFRTPTGKKYGPEFIDKGIAIGNALMEVIQKEFM